ncbi:MAG TPA: hypothetical protein PKD24_03475 [Pyrinomonadaceae bacterium]|nr:hypothetical protein [Pyrinomonadaceae bacterium]HMP64611.1 hypothetical protein [Pyrinomonadaceae bacterium]
MPKRFKWAVIGLLWAFAYGFLSVLATGGGHGNFVWFAAFLLGYFFGLFIPVMGFVGADFEPMWAKAAGATLIVLWLFFIFYWLITRARGSEKISSGHGNALNCFSYCYQHYI